MRRVKNIVSKGVTERHAEAIERLRDPGEYVLIVRGAPRTIAMSCPDGCGEILTINLDRRSGPAWQKHENKQKLTIYPSVWRDTGCRAHFIIWNDRVLWCDTSDTSSIQIDENVIKAVLKNLSTTESIFFEKLAEKLHEIPWDILWAAKALVRRKHAIEDKKGYFKKTPADKAPPINGRIDITV